MFRFGLFSVGLIFLFNPNVNLIDILPDCIGYLCICAAISRVADLGGELEDAHIQFRRLLWITLSKIPALLLALSITARSVGEETILLAMTFGYAVAEAVFGTLAFSKLFEGLAYLGTRYDGGEFLYELPPQKALWRRKKGQKPKKAKNVGTLTTFTAAFIIFKSVMTVLPELSLLSNYDTLGYITPDSAVLYRYRPLLIGISCLLVLIFGMVWLCRLLRYVLHLRSHPDFWASMSQVYAETVLPKVGLFVSRRAQAFAVLASLGVFLSVDMYLDEINYLPDFLSALFFLVAALVIAKYARTGAKALFWSSVLYLGLSSATYASMFRFTTMYTYSSVHKIERARELFTTYAGFNAAQQIAFLACVWSLAAIMKRLVSAHTGVSALTASSSSGKPLAQIFTRRTVVMRVLSVLMSVMSVAYFYFVTDVQRVELRGGEGPGGYIWLPQFSAAWIADVLLGLIFAVYTANLLSDINAEIRFKYRFE